jgi:cell division protein FtsQ
MTKRKRRAKVTSGQQSRKAAAAEFVRKKNRQKWRQWRTRVLMVAAAAIVAMFAGALWWSHHTGQMQRTTQAMADGFWNTTGNLGFRLNQIYLEGRTHADADIVKATLGVTQGAPILKLDLHALRARLLQIPEIREASVRRVLPSTLIITLAERQPAALWQRDGAHVLVDSEGVVLSRKRYPDSGRLPLIIGEDAPKYVTQLVAMLNATPSLKPQVTAAIRVGARRWNMRLTRDITVMLPEDAPETAWLRFADLAERRGLLTKAIRSVDMRLDDRVFILPSTAGEEPLILTNARDT